MAVKPKIARRDRTGSDAGRGFRYQDAVAAFLGVELWAQDIPAVVVPEGGDDVELRKETEITLVSVKSRRGTRGLFSRSDMQSYFKDLRTRATHRGNQNNASFSNGGLKHLVAT